MVLSDFIKASFLFLLHILLLVMKYMTKIIHRSHPSSTHTLRAPTVLAFLGNPTLPRPGTDPGPALGLLAQHSKENTYGPRGLGEAASALLRRVLAIGLGRKKRPKLSGGSSRTGSSGFARQIPDPSQPWGDTTVPRLMVWVAAALELG